MSQLTHNNRRFVVGVTGASGAIYALRLLKYLAPVCERLDVILTETAVAVLATETGVTLSRPYTSLAYLGEDFPCVHFLGVKDFFTPPASGSYKHDGMIIVPCSVGTLGRIANGVSDDLLTRAADVCLKERRKLILLPRETPLSLIHLRNMVALTEAGATILPTSPSFYHHPSTVEDVVDTVIARVLSHLELPQTFFPEWQAPPEE
jgi:4-hydroxy-3-polyprenylbenzoate decarboxylase